MFKGKSELTVRKDLRSRLISHAKQRAKVKNLPFDISRDDIPIPENCPVLGIKLHVNRDTYKDRSASPSIDRIIPEKGYVKGNVRIISYRANLLRNTGTVDELVLIAADAIRLANRKILDVSELNSMVFQIPRIKQP